MKTPKKGYKQITVPDALYGRIQGIAAAEGRSMPDLIRKMLGDQYPDCPAGSGEEIKGKEYNYAFAIYQNDKNVGVFKTDSIVVTRHTPALPKLNQAPVSARGLLHFDIKAIHIEEGGIELRGFIGDPEISVKITGVVFMDYAWGTPIVTSMKALTFEIIDEEGKR